MWRETSSAAARFLDDPTLPPPSGITHKLKKQLDNTGTPLYFLYIFYFYFLFSS